MRSPTALIHDSGSTTYEVAAALRTHESLTVITNDLRIAKFIATVPDIRLLVTGGELLGSVYTLVGDRAEAFLADYAADWTFLGADAIHPAAGITNTNTLEVPIKRAMIAAAVSTIVVTDSSKFGHHTLAKVAALDEITQIITDPQLPTGTAEQYGDQLTRTPHRVQTKSRAVIEDEYSAR
ncbi:hypothetical protein [Haloechinothrix aidingensis]|uniref:DeoR/GlpR family DNA-binding transcription regulator n=1 Tax=Haloechinothrix aidingensis TaxID=2752311 RepID=UPI0031B64342